MSKRYAEDAAGGGGSGNGGPPRKKVVMEPLTIGPISNLEELEMKTLQFQNQKLGMRLNQRIQVCTLYTGDYVSNDCNDSKVEIKFSALISDRG